MLGQFKSTVDIKGRMNFPAKLREELGECFVISKIIDIDKEVKCIKVYSKAGWQEIIEKTKVKSQIKVANLQRFLMANACDIEVDKQGRIIIPQALREYAGLDNEVVIVGLGEQAEIWNKAKWEAMNSFENMEELASIAMELGI